MRPPGGYRYSSDKASEVTEKAAEKATEPVKESFKEVPKKKNRTLRRTVWGTTVAATLLVGYLYGTDTRASIHRYGVVPLIRMLYPDAEDAHHVGVDTLKTLYEYGLHPRERGNPDGDGALTTEVNHLLPTLLAR